MSARTASARALRVLPVVLFAAVVGCGPRASESTDVAASPGAVDGVDLPSKSDERPLEGSRAVLWVRGMSCPKCVSNIDLQLKRLPGVDSVAINMNAGTVSVGFVGTERPTRGQIAKAVDDAALTLFRIEMVP
jgi:copper chaperone CopZ